MLRVWELVCPGIHRQLEGHRDSLWEMTEGHEGKEASGGRHRKERTGVGKNGEMLISPDLRPIFLQQCVVSVEGQ